MKENRYHEMRQGSARKILDLNDLGGILFISLENIRYLCGFTGSDGAFLLTRKESFFLTDSRYWTQAEEEVQGCQIIRYKKKVEAVASLVSDSGLKRIGFESPSLTFSSYRSLLQKLTNALELVPLDNEIKNLRSVKDPQELALIQSAIDISSNAFLHIIDILEEGVVEKEIAMEMEFFIKRNGAEAMSFDIIMASGKRSALPHGKATDKKIEKGDLILIDFGSKYGGYHSDQTRTIVCGKPTSEQKKVYQAVKEAHDQAIKVIRPGLPIQELDAAARNHIKEKGYGEYFGHGTGHGIGLAVHEEPGINMDNQGPLQEGMVFTVEPGIYLPNWGGVRIEDMVRVTPQGAEVLTSLPGELRVI